MPACHVEAAIRQQSSRLPGHAQLNLMFCMGSSFSTSAVVNDTATPVPVHLAPGGEAAGMSIEY